MAEVRRLTNSTWGLAYAELNRLPLMERDEFLTIFGDRVVPFGAAWLEERRALPPEGLARAMVEEGQRRATASGQRWESFDPFEALLEILR